MRLSALDREIIRQVTSEVTAGKGTAYLFGSRLNESAKGGDWDILVRLDEPVDDPVWMVAQISGRISLRCQGRKVDVVLDAPNLKRQPIHEVAIRQGVAA